MKNHKRSLRIFLLISLPLFIISCNFNSIYDNVFNIPDTKWSKKQAIIFDVPVKDTLNGYSLLLNIRNNNEYPYSNCFLFISTRSPKGVIRKDTMEYVFADDKGKWLGRGFGGVWNNELHYKSNIRFPNSGNYRIEVSHGMRDEPLKGIMDVGLRIERVK